MSKMMDELHRIRAEHHERVKDLPLEAQSQSFPDKCAHCEHSLPPAGMTRRAGDPPPKDCYLLLKVRGLDDGKATVDVQSPACPNCGKRTVFTMQC